MEDYYYCRYKVDYKGWIEKTRSFSDVQSLFFMDSAKKFEEWAEKALYGEKTVIDGITIEKKPGYGEIIQRCRYLIEF